MDSKLDVVVAGVTCIDLAPKFQNDPETSIAELFRPSSTLFVGKMTTTPGGAVSNTGLALCRFGMRTRLMGRVGQDDLGNLLLRKFEPWTDTSSFERSEEEGTSYSLVIAPIGIDRFFIHDPAVNDTFTTQALDFDEIEKARLFHFGYLPVMRAMCQNTGEEAVRMYRRIHELGVTTSMDLCMPDVSQNYPDGYWMNILRRVLPYVDLFEPSVEELCYMIDAKRFRDLKKAGEKEGVVGSIGWDGIEAYADQMLGMGAGAVLVKCGTKGMFLKAGTKDRLKESGTALHDILEKWSGARVVQRCFVPDSFVNSNGAGDVSIAAFLASVLRHMSAKESVRNAAAAGAECCEGADPICALTDFEELMDRIHGGWKLEEER